MPIQHSRPEETNIVTQPVQFPPCPDCEGPLKLRDDLKYAYCIDDSCDADGFPAGEVVGEDGQPERGLPRPVLERRPVPWVAPVIGDRVAWIALNTSRQHEVEQSWVCQMCGCVLDSAPTAWVAVSGGEVAAGGAMHQGCMEIARKACPILRSDRSFVFAEVVREHQARDWAAMTDRLVAFEEQHEQLPRILPLLP